MKLYHYSAFVTDVYDGDSITVDISLGFDAKLEDQKIRLFGLNAPEVRGKSRPEGLVSRDWLREQILGKTVWLETIKKKKNGSPNKNKYQVA